MNEYVEVKTEEVESETGEFRSKRKRYSEEELENEYYPRELFAGFFIRFISFLVDSMIASAIVSIVLGTSLSLANIEPSTKVYGLGATIITLLYFTITTYGTNGQTLGKMIFSLKVVRLDGKKLDLLTVIIREFVGRFIHSYGILFLLYGLTGLTEKKQNLSDLFADTSVISLSKESAYFLGMENKDRVHV